MSKELLEAYKNNLDALDEISVILDKTKKEFEERANDLIKKIESQAESLREIKKIFEQLIPIIEHFEE